MLADEYPFTLIVMVPCSWEDLWNDDYKLLTPNFRQAYDEFLRNTLLSMTTNTLDKKRNSNGTYSLFSFIQKLDPDLQTSRSAKEKKTLEYNYGFVNFIADLFFYLVVNYRVRINRSGIYCIYFSIFVFSFIEVGEDGFINLE